MGPPANRRHLNFHRPPIRSRRQSNIIIAANLRCDAARLRAFFANPPPTHRPPVARALRSDHGELLLDGINPPLESRPWGPASGTGTRPQCHLGRANGPAGRTSPLGQTFAVRRRQPRRYSLNPPPNASARGASRSRSRPLRAALDEQQPPPLDTGARQGTDASFTRPSDPVYQATSLSANVRRHAAPAQLVFRGPIRHHKATGC